MDKYCKFVKGELSISAEKLSTADNKRLAEYILQVMALETPAIAKMRRRELEEQP